MAQPKFRAGVAAIASVIILGFGLYLIVPDRAAPSSPTVQTQATTVSYQGVEGKDALTLLKEKHRVETESSAFGEFVKSIDGVAPDSSHFWGFYVNGQLAEIGAGSYVTKNSDQLTWQLDAIQ